jgi:ABC-type transport system involved in Fe-S cluster assembly fused permease/ATPase subunit
LKKLPDTLSVEQKRTKIKNNLQSLREKGAIATIQRVIIFILFPTSVNFRSKQ